MKKRILSLLLALTMVFLFIPAGVFSEGEGDQVIEEVLAVEPVVEEVPAEEIIVEAANEAVEEQPVVEEQLLL